MAFTYFFRDFQTIDLAVRHLVPAAAGKSRIRLWDAGCAMGPEPFTLAIVLAENMGRFAFKNVRIDATDVDGSSLFGEVIAAAEYPREELDRIPREIFERYFAPADRPGFFRLDESVRGRVSYRKHDLLTLCPVGDGYSLILCKNVLLHFQPAERVEVLKMFHEALTPGGLFATEQTQKLPAEVSHLFQQVAPDAQLFRKAEARP